MEKSEESSFYLTALTSAISQPIKTKTIKQPSRKVSLSEYAGTPDLKISGRSSGLRSEAFDEVDDDDDDDDDDYDEDDDDYYEDEDDDDDNDEKFRSYRVLDATEWREVGVNSSSDSFKGDINVPMKGFQESSLTADVSNTLVETSSTALGRDAERAQTLSLIETIRRTSNYDNVFTLK